MFNSPLGHLTTPIQYRQSNDGAGSGGGVSTSRANPISHIDDLLLAVIESKGTDLHLGNGTEVWVRVGGKMLRNPNFPQLTGEEVRELVYGVLRDDQIRHFETYKSVDFAYQMPNSSGGRRFRGNIFFENGHPAVALRLLNENIPTIKELGLPNAFLDFAKQTRGLVLVTGPTGSGKSTSLAALVQEINTNRQEHIITIEQPIEYVHSNNQCLVRQREVGRDTLTFADGLKDALRDDPDIILLGELRDKETIETAIHAAETGHLVLATLHVTSTTDAVDRLVDVFENSRRDQVRAMLGNILNGVVCQQLIPGVTPNSRVLASEVMLMTAAIANNIKRGQNAALRQTIETNMPKGMYTLDQNLASLVSANRITRETAITYAYDKDVLAQIMKK